eukprot:GHVL01045050.1.p1 GENE.GHVL01045050.1~~GHVL01045050.1.p1  ORF type:complete len:230 (-),score=56.48 GHVL01045050.1:33-722(-)
MILRMIRPYRQCQNKLCQNKLCQISTIICRQFTIVKEKSDTPKIETSESSDAIHIMKVPHMGDSVTEGEIQTWYKNVGTILSKDELLCIIDTDKISVDVHAEVSGKLVSVAASTGGTVYVGGDLASIDRSFCKKEEETNRVTPEIQKTVSQTVSHNNKRYIQSVKFIDWKNIKKKDIKEDISKISVNTIKGVKVIRYENYSDLPDIYKSKSITETEIDYINTGGIQLDN